VAGVPARTASELVGVDRNTAILFYHKLRELIATKLAEETAFLDAEVEVDESYFGGVRKGKRGRGALGKVPMFGRLKRGGKVHAIIIPNTESATPVSIIRERIRPDSIVCTDSFRSYDISMYPNSTITRSITPEALSQTAIITSTWSGPLKALHR
jgi:transposase